MSEFDKAVQESKGSDGNSIAQLERTIAELEDKLEEQRFFWIAIIFIIFDSLTFPTMQTWSAPLGILLIQLVILVVLAKRCGIEEVGQLLDKILNTAANRRD